MYEKCFFTKESLIPSIVRKTICNWIHARICPSLTRKVTSLDGVTKLAITTVVSATKINEITANNLMCYLNKSTLLDIKQIKDQRILIQTKVYYELFYSAWEETTRKLSKASN